jgi:hypothetical protein
MLLNEGVDAIGNVVAVWEGVTPRSTAIVAVLRF